MFELIRGALAMVAAVIGSVLDAQTGSIVVLVSLTMLIAAAVVATRLAVPIAIRPGAQQVLALRSRGAAVIRACGTAPTLRRRHRARAPGSAA